MHYLRATICLILTCGMLIGIVPAADAPKTNARVETSKTSTQQLVESVDIQGNRRLRDEDLLYYIRTRPGDTFNPAQLEKDLKELLSLNFFEKTETRVITEQESAAESM